MTELTDVQVLLRWAAGVGVAITLLSLASPWLAELGSWCTERWRARREQAISERAAALREGEEQPS